MGETMTKVISFSLYGNLPKYNIGAIKNSELYKKFFPDWEMWVYYNDSVPQETLDALIKNDVKLINTQVDEGPRNALWRFLPAGDESVEYFISRDCDSRLFERDVISVNDWIESEKPFHIIREHPWGHTWVINAGMWGCVGGFIEDIEESMNEYFQKSDKVNVREVDQWFLKECIYPVVKEHSFISDEFVNFEGKSISINRDRKIDNFAFIGEPFDENDKPLDPSHRELIKDYYNRK
jgi:hypothetical protein